MEDSTDKNDVGNIAFVKKVSKQVHDFWREVDDAWHCCCVDGVKERRLSESGMK